MISVMNFHKLSSVHKIQAHPLMMCHNFQQRKCSSMFEGSVISNLTSLRLVIEEC
jgi:hypothetical protein